MKSSKKSRKKALGGSAIASAEQDARHYSCNNVAATTLHNESCCNNMRKKPKSRKAKGPIRRGKGWKRIAKKPSKELLKNDSVRRWYENLYRSSVNSAGVGLRKLNLFCDRIGMTPWEFADAGKKDARRAEDILLDHVAWLESHKYTEGYMEAIVKTVKSWASYNRIDIKTKIRFKNSKVATTLENEVIPTPAQIKEILDAAPPRARVIVSLMAFSGIRPQVMGMADGSDGLKLGDFANLHIDGKTVSFGTVPTVLVIRSSLSKINTKYVTFLSKTACEAILGYLRMRMSEGEKLGPDSPLIRIARGWENRGWSHHKKSIKPFMCTSAITSSVSPIIKSVTKIRTYALRSYFDSQLLLAESNGCMTHAYRQFFMGHKGDIEARYTTNKGRLTEQMLEDMRRCYRNSQYFLYPDDAEGREDKAGVLREIWRQQAVAIGLDVSEIMGKPAEGKEPPKARPADPKAEEGGQDVGPKNKVVSGDEEMVRHLDMGWDIVRELANNRYVMRQK